MDLTPASSATIRPSRRYASISNRRSGFQSELSGAGAAAAPEVDAARAALETYQAHFIDITSI
jgi:hypothetical protein